MDRETGNTLYQTYEAFDEREAMRYASEAGFIVGAVQVLHDPVAAPDYASAPPLPASLPPVRRGPTFRPTFKTHLTPKIAKATASSGLILAICGPIGVMVLALGQSGDLSDPYAWIQAVLLGVVSFVVFGMIALHLRLWAELASILFDIYRLLRDLNKVSGRQHGVGRE